MSTFTVMELKKALNNIDDDDLPVTYLVNGNAMCDTLNIAQVVIVKDPVDKTNDKIVLSEESILY